MALPNISLLVGKVSWTDPSLNSDGSVIPVGEVTGYQVALRSLTAAGSVVGTYPLVAPVVAPPTVTSQTFLNMGFSPALKPDSYAVSMQALSANGPSTWGVEFQFNGVLPVPLPPTAITAG